MRDPTVDPEDPYRWPKPISEDELKTLAADRVVALQKYKPGADVSAFTCAACPINRECTLAFDLYNTDGDCLDLK